MGLNSDKGETASKIAGLWQVTEGTARTSEGAVDPHGKTWEAVCYFVDT